MAVPTPLPKDEFDLELNYLLGIEGKAKQRIAGAKGEAERIIHDAEKSASEAELQSDKQADIEIKGYQAKVQAEIADYRDRLGSDFLALSSEIERIYRERHDRAIKLIHEALAI